MIFPTETVTKRYYFVNDGVIYDIGLYNDADKCGVRPVFDDYDGEYPTNEQEIKTGINGDKPVYDSSGNPKKEKVIDWDKFKDVYPNICVTYNRCELSNGVVSETGTTDFKKYLWLDKLIVDGDKYIDSKFSVGAKHGSTDTDFSTRYQRLIIPDIIKNIIGFGTIDKNRIKKYYPYYLRDTTDEKDAMYTSIDGWYVKIKSITGSKNLFTDTELNTIVKNYIKEKMLDTANQIMSKVGKEYEVKPTVNDITNEDE